MYRSQIRGILVLPSPDPNAFLVLALGLRKIQFFLVVHDFPAGSLLGFWFFISIRFLVAGHPFSSSRSVERQGFSVSRSDFHWSTFPAHLLACAMSSV
jgi:hypothetical protein